MRKSDDHLFGNCMKMPKKHFLGISDDIFLGEDIGYHLRIQSYTHITHIEIYTVISIFTLTVYRKTIPKSLSDPSYPFVWCHRLQCF